MASTKKKHGIASEIAMTKDHDKKPVLTIREHLREVGRRFMEVLQRGDYRDPLDFSHGCWSTDHLHVLNQILYKQIKWEIRRCEMTRDDFLYEYNFAEDYLEEHPELEQIFSPASE